jgi:hypothetical protein
MLSEVEQKHVQRDLSLNCVSTSLRGIEDNVEQRLGEKVWKERDWQIAASGRVPGSSSYILIPATSAAVGESRLV